MDNVDDERLSIVVSTRTFLPIVGGAEMGIHEIYDRIGRRHDVTIITPTVAERWADAYGAQDYSSASYAVKRLMPRLDPAGTSLLGRILKRTSLPYLLAAARLRREGRTDVVNAHFIAPHALYLAGLRYVLGVPTMLSLVGRTDVVASLSTWRRRYARLALRVATTVVVNSNYYLRGEERRRTATVIPYGVDTTAYSPDRRSEPLRERLGIGPEDVMLLCVQRLVAAKRVDVLVAVLAEVLRERSNVTLVVGGKGPESERIRQVAEKLGVADHVRFAGYVDDGELPAYFASADLFVFHSLMETFGIVFAQAMASGLPIVAARTSCVPDVVGDGGGALVEPFDVQAFARAVLELCADSGRRGAIAAKNRRRAVAEFDWDVIASRYERELWLLAAHTRRS